ncbi:hypothetical protein [Sediminicola luteus]|uniref:Uncharacterized protein n=1 Tax=Sediminicola luteus TaxID=319238 RepID=A0A2A4G3X5_9FLAO|nr:hypothetical protein [Sediminicola luteus]PCE62462.1 hypothetical protein B7P33_19105 [Sediminicola luteus]
MRKKDAHKNPFQVPSGYFDNLEARIEKQLNNAPTFGKSDGFGVPNDYFDGLEKKVLAQVLPNTKNESKLRPLYYALSAAAALALLLLSSQLFNSANEIDYTDLAFSDYETYWNENPIGIELDEFDDYLTLDDTELDALYTNDLDHSIILEYLEENTNGFEVLEASENFSEQPFNSDHNLEQ